MKTAFIAAFGTFLCATAAFAGDTVETYPGDQADTVSISGAVGTAAGEIHADLLKSGAQEEGGCGVFFAQSGSIEGERIQADEVRSVSITVDHSASSVTVTQDDQGSVVTLGGQAAEDLLNVLSGAGVTQHLACGRRMFFGEHVTCINTQWEDESYSCTIRLEK